MSVPFSEREEKQKLEEYLYILLTSTKGKSVADIGQAVDDGVVKKEEFEALIEKLESGGFDVVAGPMEVDVPKMIDDIKAGIKGKRTTDNKLKVKGFVDDLINNRPDGFFEHLEKEKKNRNLPRFKRNNKDEINRVIEYATDKPEIRERLESEYPKIFGFVEMALTPPDNLSVLKYFQKLSQAKLTINEKKYAVAPPLMELKTAANEVSYLGESVFTVTPSFEYFMRQNSLNVDKIATKKPKKSLQLDVVLNDIDRNTDLDKYGDLEIDLQDIGQKLKGSLPQKLKQLKRLMDGDAEILDAMERAMAIAEKKDRLKLPRDDVFVIAYPKDEKYNRKSENFNNFTNKYFDGNREEAYDFVLDNSKKLDMIRDRNYKGDEITIPDSLKRIFEELTTVDEFDSKGSLEMKVPELTYLRSLNDFKFANTNNVADYLETISLIQEIYLDDDTLRKANAKYVDKEMDYEKLIELYEKEFSNVKDKFIDMIGERVQGLSKTRDTLSQKIRPVIQEVFGE